LFSKTLYLIVSQNKHCIIDPLITCGKRHPARVDEEVKSAQTPATISNVHRQAVEEFTGVKFKSH